MLKAEVLSEGLPLFPFLSSDYDFALAALSEFTTNFRKRLNQS